MDAELVLTMQDEKTEIVVRKFATYFRFTVRPHDEPSTMVNTRHYAFADEAVAALIKLGYSDADALVEHAMDDLRSARTHSDIEI